MKFIRNLLLVIVSCLLSSCSASLSIPATSSSDTPTPISSNLPSPTPSPTPSTSPTPTPSTSPTATPTPSSSPSPIVYTVGGTVSGLTGTLVLSNNSSDTISITTNGSFTFANTLSTGASYSVTRTSQPTNQTCTVTSSSGTLSSSNITSISVTCATNTYTVGGSVSGLSGTLVLNNNSSDTLSISANGAFTFNNRLTSGTSFSVTVTTQPTNQTCTVTSGSGTMSSSNLAAISVSCAASTYTIGGSVSGLSGTLQLVNNGTDSLSVTSNGSFTFATALANSATYSVIKSSDPSGQSCTLSGTSGTVSAANVTTVSITCTSYTACSGDSYCPVYITTTHNGNLGGISGADTICNADSNKPATAHTYHYKALLVDGVNRRACTSSSCVTGGTTEHIDWVFSPTTLYHYSGGSTSGAPCITDANGLFSSGSQGSGTCFAGNFSVWTGLIGDQSSNIQITWLTGSSYLCSSGGNPWTSTSGSVYGYDTQTGAATFNQQYVRNHGCSASEYLLCIAQ